ncbi:PH domain-containing protein [Halobacillus naozhouensis]
MSEPKRLHPISAVLNFAKGLKEAILPIVAIFFFNGNGGDGFLAWLPLILSGAFLLIILLAGFLKWLRFSYWIDEGELRIEHGLLFRKKRYIPLERIQSLDFSEGILHRPFQLVKVSIETAASSGLEAEAVLTAIKRVDAKELEKTIYEGKSEQSSFENDAEMPEENDRSLVYQMSTKDIILMAVTSGGAGVVISGVAVFLSQFTEFLPIEAIYEEVVDWLQFGIFIVGILAAFVLVIAYGVAVILTVLRFGNFSVFHDGDDLVITRGLLEKKQVTIPLNRIQGIRIDENLIRQPLGYATVSIISAGGSIKGGDEQQFKVLPFIKRKQIETVLTGILPQYALDVSPERPPKRSKLRYVIRCLWLPLLVSIAVSVFFWPLGLLSLLIIPALIGLGLLNYRDAGWNIREKQLMLSNRFITKQTYFVKKHRIQSCGYSMSIPEQRSRLSSIEVMVKTGAGKTRARCLYLDENDTKTIMKWFQT